MAKRKSKLKNALNRQLGKDPVREKHKKVSRRQPKKRRSVGVDGVCVGSEVKEREEEVEEEEEDKEKEGGEDMEREDEDEEESEDENSDIALSDVDKDNLQAPDLLLYQKLTINNHSALTQALERITLPLSSRSFLEHQSVTTDAPVEIKDVDDDLNRELAFYKQALDAVNIARKKLMKDGITFTRPADYFAEMLKDDEHMGLIKQRLLDDATKMKAAAEARRQRDLRKFGKQVQFAKLEERSRAKKDTLDKIQVLKRKRQGAETALTDKEDMFDMALDGAVNSSRRKDKGDRDSSRASRAKRQKKDQKYGHGGKRRFSKSGDAASSADMNSFSTRKNKASFEGVKKMRPGKSKRSNAK